MPVNTAKVQGRRQLDYASLEELLTDAERLSSAPIKALGNWSPGQIFRHLALAFNCSIDGFKVKFPWYLCLIGKLFRKRLLSGSMPPGFNLPAEGGETLLPPPTSTEEGLADLRAAIERLEREPNRAIHPVFGQMDKEQWNQIHCKHASMHMSFLVPM
jgi:hypothetical protein